MKMRHFFLAILMTLTFVGSGFSLANTVPPSTVAILVPAGKEGLTMVTVPPLLDAEVAENFFRKLRQDLEKAEQLKNHDPHKITLKSFTTVSASFFVAIAAVQIESLLVNFHDNPRGLEDHIATLKDPIGHLSFYMFMVANGMTSKYLMKGIKDLDPLSRAQAMRAINYKGMAMGSLASSLTAEVGGMLKECAKIIFAKEKEEKLEKLKVCDSSLAQWKRSTKAQQYTAQIISLIISTEAAQIIEMKGRKAVSWSKQGLAKAMPKTTGRAFQVMGVQLVSTVSGGAVTKGLRVVGKIAQFAGFTYIDHLIAAPVQKAVANLWQPINFDFDAARFNEDVFLAKNSSWQDDRKNLALAEDLSEMTKTMSEWRQAQLTKFQMSHSTWISMLMKVIDQTSGTFEFYKSYLENLFTTKHLTGEIEAGRLPPTAMNNENNYPYRLLPLFGVKLSEALPADYESEEDLYLNKPSDLESEQIATVRKANEKFKAYIASQKLHEMDAELLNEISQNLDSNDLTVVAQGLGKINDVLIYNRRFVTDAGVKKFLLDFRNELGNPYPILSPGMAFTYAYDSHSFNKEAMRKYPHSEGPGKWLPRTSDYLMLQMICGGEKEVYAYPWGFAPYFIPPKIVDKTVKTPALCGSLDLRNLHSMKIQTTSGQTYKGLNDLVSKNIRAEILGDITKEENKNTFANWWLKNINTQLGDLYRQFDSQYVNVLGYLTENWQGYDLKHNCSLKDYKIFSSCLGKVGNTAIDGLNQSDYLDKNALQNLSFELDIYVSILNELIIDSSNDNLGLLGTKKFGVTIDPAINKGQRNDGKTSKRLQVLQEWGETATNSGKDFGGYLRRLKAGDAGIIKGQKYPEVKSLMAIRDALRARLLIFAKINIKDGVITNFPEKADSKKALADLEAAFKTFSENQYTFSESQKIIFEAAVSGIQSISGEITSMNMAFYAAKYKMEDSYEDVMSNLKTARGETPAPKKPGFNPRGG